MCDLQIRAQCFGRYFEVLPDSVEHTELLIEEAMSYVLLDLFEEGVVDDVSIKFSPTLRMGLKHCLISVRAQCPCHAFVLLPRTNEHMKCALTQHVGSLLKELFESVDVDIVLLHTSSADSGTALFS